MDGPMHATGSHEEDLPNRVLRLEAQVARLQEELARLRPEKGFTAQVETTLRTEAAPPPPPPFPEAGSEFVNRQAGPTEAERVSGGTTVPPSGIEAPTPRQRHVPWFGRTGQGSDVSLEDRLGSQWFNRIGIVLLLLGTSWFLKLAIDRGWIVPSPIARVIAGLVAGAGFVLWSESFRRKGFWAFSYSLKALGSGVLYLSLWAGFRLYGLLPAAVALALMIAVTAWNAFMAWAQDAQLLAAYALAGGFATPILLSTGGNHEIFLFTYLAAIDAAAVALVRLKHWPRLLLGAFPATVAYFVGWYFEYWSKEQLAITGLFIALFGVVFGSVALDAGALPGNVEETKKSRAGSALLEEILAPLLNAAFIGLALYAVLDESGHHAWLPWMVLVLAAVYLGVMRAPQSRTADAIHLSLAVVFLTIAIPLKASGHWITAGWLVEGLALLWVATRLGSGEGESDVYPATVLRWLGCGALALGFCGIVFHVFPPDPRAALWTSDTATALLGAVIFAAAAWLAIKSGRVGHWREVLIGTALAVDAVAVLLAMREILFGWDVVRVPLQSGAFGSAVLALLVFAGATAVSVRRMQADPDETFWPVLAGLSVVLFNATAVLTGVREISAVWGGAVDADAALKQGLAISAYLMAYGAALLALGFLRRSAFLRWQGLGLLLFTILKTFLWDMRNLSQGYRVASFLALGALLMAVSYAYQRDWLALRTKPSGPGTNDEQAR